MTFLQQRSRCDRIVFLAVLFACAFFAPSARGEIVVGRITAVEGQLLRFVPDQNDWVATVRDAPFGVEDALYSDQEGKAEIIMPDNIWIRLGGSTQLQLIAAKPEAIEVDVSLGVVRIFNESADSVIKATTPFGYVVAPQNASFDLYVGDQSVEVVALSGTVDFIHGADNAKYEVVSGEASVIANATQVGTGEGTVEEDWSAWNQTRNDVWAKRDAEAVQSAQYLPEALKNDAYELEENGRWERVSYQGREIEMWRPTEVAEDWAPFTAGRWTEWNGDNTWVPDEPFGYTTHHYGNWINIDGRWYWQPPPPSEPEPSWYPGRVAWVGSDDDVGWVPLAPEEPYYSHRQWGPAATVITAGVATGIAVASLRYWNRAVFVPEKRFYGENNYARIRTHDHMNRKFDSSRYRSSPDFNKVLGDRQATRRDRFAFTNAEVKNKPHQSVNEHIRRNQGASKQAATEFNAKSVRQTLKNAKTTAPSKQAEVSAPRITNKFVPANQVNKPASEVKFGHQNPKGKAIPVSATPQQTGVKGSGTHRTPGGPSQQPGLTGPRGPRTPTAPDAASQQPGLTGPRGPRSPGTTAPVGPSQQPGLTGPRGPRTPTAPDAASQQPGLTGPRGPRTHETTAPVGPSQQPGLTGPRGPRTPTAPDAVSQQPGLTGPRGPRTHETTAPVGPSQQPGLTGPRGPRATETAIPGASSQQRGVTGSRTPVTTDSGSATQAQQQQRAQQQQQLQQQRAQEQQRAQQQQQLQQQQQQRAQQQQQLQQQRAQEQQRAQQQQQLQQQQQQRAQQQQQLQQQRAQEQQRAQQQQQLQQQQQQRAQQQQQLQQQRAQEQQRAQQQQQQLQQQQQQRAQQQQQHGPQQNEALRKLCQQNPQDPRCK